MDVLPSGVDELSYVGQSQPGEITPESYRRRCLEREFVRQCPGDHDTDVEEESEENEGDNDARYENVDRPCIVTSHRQGEGRPIIQPGMKTGSKPRVRTEGEKRKLVRERLS